jgi:acetylornithine/N-succinyldiaminopimelate aminotransferase
VLSLSDHGSTFGGNPVCCAAALSVLGRMNQPLYDEINEKSRFMITELTGLPGVKSLSGMGLMLGIETVNPARETALQCLEKGVLVLTAKGKIRLLPPVNIPWPLLRIGMAALAESLA